MPYYSGPDCILGLIDESVKSTLAHARGNTVLAHAHAYGNTALAHACGNAVLAYACGNAVLAYAYSNATLAYACSNDGDSSSQARFISPVIRSKDQLP